MRALSILQVITMLLVMATGAMAATISGRVTFPKPEESGSEAGGYSRGVYRPPVKKDLHQHGGTDKEDAGVIVWAEPVSGKAPFKKPAANPKVVQQNKMFVPHVLAVQTGTTVEFPNLDPLYHNVFSYSRAKRFDLGRYEQGKSKSITFDNPGVVDVFCEIHENMRAYILVLDSPWFTRLDEDGAFSLDVPAGKYRVFAWMPNKTSEPVEVVLSSVSSSEKVEFAF